MEEALRDLQIQARHSNAMWEAAKKLAVCIKISTNGNRIFEYLEDQSNLTWSALLRHNGGVFFSQYGQMDNVSAALSKAGR